MAFDRKTINEILKGAEVVVPKDVLNQIFDEHTESVAEFKTTNNTLKEDLKTVTKERDDLKNQDPPKDDAEAKRIQTEFDNYKAEVEGKEAKTKLDKSISDALKNAKFSDSVLDLLAKDKAFENVKLDDKGEIVGLDDAIKSVSTSRADLIVNTGTDGNKVKGIVQTGGDSKIGRAQLKEMTTSEINEAWAKGLVDTSAE